MSSKFPLFLLACFCYCLAIAQAPVEGNVSANDTVTLSVIRIFPDSFPNVSIIFKAQTPDKKPVWKLAPADLSVTEDGRPCNIVRLQKVSEERAVNTALVIDHSGSMSEDEPLRKWWDSLPPSAWKHKQITKRESTDGEVDSDEMIAVRISPQPPAWYHNPLWYAQQASLSYISSVKPGKDSVSIVGFAQTVDAVSPLSRNHGSAIATINGLYPSGATAFYDGVDRALEQLKNSGSIRAVIALTDGNDNTSQKSLQSVIQKAKKLNIPVFVIGLGDVEKTQLKKLARETGGESYFTNDKKQLASIYQTISRRIQSVYEVVYTSPSLSSADSTREVSLQFHIDDKFLDSRDLAVDLPDEVLSMLRKKEEEAARQAVIAATPDDGTYWSFIAGGIAVVLLGAGVVASKSRRKKQKSALLITNIFPNPSPGAVTVTFTCPAGEQPELIILNSAGSQVFSEQLQPESNTHQLNLEQLPAGNYVTLLKGSTAVSAAHQLVITR
jgi:Ca-activated chloride channel family protein